MTGLPIEQALPALEAALKSRGIAVLEAPPGAGKTTRVPLFLIEKALTSGRILMLEPRRLATRAAAERMAETLGETVGQTVGFRMRGDSKSSPATRIEVITEGILTRMIQTDPELSGTTCIIFDEFHERSLQADLGLALALEVRAALRPDLMIIAMSATLDAAPVAALMENAPVVTAQGRSFPVEIHHLEKPWAKPNTRGPWFENAAADLVHTAIRDTKGGILVFLPGEGEIRRVQSLLQDRIPSDVTLQPLFGALPFAQQRAAIAPAKQGRKCVLATSIAETSLTIQDIRVVVDCGRARRARFDAGSGLSRLVTERVTKAEATQRTGRAGRVASGICYRLWTKGEEGGLAPFPLPEILSADITGLVLDLAQWGSTTAHELPFLNPPRDSDFANAQSLLRSLGALDANNRITDHGKRLARHPVHPRLAHMLEIAGKNAAPLAALFEARDPLPRTAPADLSLRLKALENPQKFQSDHPYTPNPTVLKSIKAEAKRLKAPIGTPHSPAEMAALAYPDRIGLRRTGDAPRYVLSGGKGAVFRDDDPTGTNRLIVATDLDGDGREARIRLALPITQSEVSRIFADQIETRQICEWSKRDRRVLSLQQTCLGALVLDQQNWKDCPPDATSAAMTDGIRDLGIMALPWTPAARLFQARVGWLAAQNHPLPDLGDAALMETLTDWLEPHLSGLKTPDALKKLDMLSLLQSQLTWDQQQQLDTLAPAAIKAPTGTRLPIDYGADQPKIAVRLQEMFGMTTHPTAGPKRLPLLIELLSPAQRPVQTTADLPRFWATSYADVRKDMRGRYPKHPWPEDPTAAEPTRRRKPKT